MRHAHSVAQVRAAEAALMARLPEGALMQRAAAGLAVAIARFVGRTYGARVLLLVGTGDNGGDALWAGARLARRGAQVTAVLMDPERVHMAGLAGLAAAGGRVIGVGEVGAALARWRPDVVVDGIVGIGGGGGLRAEAAGVVAACAGLPMVAVDLPSGVAADDGRALGEHVRADLTVTFGTYKPAHFIDPGASACGEVALVDIGLRLPEPVVSALTAADVAALLPRPTPSAHKYTRGVVGVRTGSDAYPGAGVLSVAGASCGLAGMVRYLPVGTPAGGGAADDSMARRLVLTAHPEVVVGAGQLQAWVVGSGGGAGSEVALTGALADGVPVVVDADALAAVTGPLAVPAVLTPHAGELARMLEVERAAIEEAPWGFAREAADRFGCTVLLKGRRTLIASPGRATWVNETGVPWLATAGSGDVLGGLIGALLAAGLGPHEAAGVGAWLHGTAGERAAQTQTLTASGIAAALPAVLADLTRRTS